MALHYQNTFGPSCNLKGKKDTRHLVGGQKLNEMLKPEPQVHISQKMATVDKINPKKEKDLYETDFPHNTTGDKDRKRRKN